MTRADTALAKVQPGDILADKYRVERVLGQGAMGVVVLAEHIELRERVAIKFLLDTPADSAELAERFLREARAAVRIKSEHVVRVSDVGRLPSGAPYMVMEYLEGEDLSQRLLSGVAVPIDDAVDYVIQCCEAMQVAHRSGIVHRDLKPANLFLTQRHDGSSLIKVLDFGISKVKALDAAQLSLTHTQAMMGSPLYMSPEQMRSSKDVSPSADIWSIGVVLYELLSGELPFMGETFPEVLVKVMSEEPPPLCPLRPEVPAGLEAVVLRCLQKDPADRYATVAHLGVALAPYASPRTLGLQARLRGSLSRPPPAPSPRLLDSTYVPPLPVEPAIAATLATLQSHVVVGEPPTAKTNTAWVGHSAAPARTSSWRRHRARWIAASASLVGVLGALGVWVASSAPRTGASATHLPEEAGAASATAAASRPSVVAPLPEPARGVPASDAPAAPAEPAGAIGPRAAEPHVETTPMVAPVREGVEAAPTVTSGEHPPVGSTDATAATVKASAHAAVSGPLPSPVRSATRKASVGKGAKSRASAGVAAAAPERTAPATAPAAAPAKARSKTLSIEFK
jgi:eukaryotic-like serine/threonine-protein kinase